MNKFVVDSSVILALINEESYHITNLENMVRQDSIICAVNYVEIMSKLIEKNVGDIDQLEYLVKSVYCKNIYYLNDQINTVAAHLSIYKQKHNLSLGDRYCIALGKVLNLPIYTADKIWKQLETKLDLKIVLIR